MANILIYSDDPHHVNGGLVVAAEMLFQDQLLAALRKVTKPLTLGAVAQMLGGKPGDERIVTISIRVNKWSCVVHEAGQTEFMKAGTAHSPGINQIMDYRKRPRPA
jgi:hypothetical protein